MTTKMEQYRAIEVEDMPAPEDMMPGITYVEADGTGKPWMVAFLCPCGCGDPSYCRVRGAVPNDPGPTWEMTRHNGTISLTPSIHRIPDRTCGAHFWLTQGNISWAEPAPQRA